MSTKSMLVLCACLIICCMILGKSAGEAPAKQGLAPPAGRFQFSSLSREQGIVVLDTATGHCWSCSRVDIALPAWTDLGSPAEKVEKKP